MIGILGASGAIGQKVCERLLDCQRTPLRLGYHHRARYTPRRGAAQIEHCQVNIEDALSLARFIDGCDLVLNCAGPSHRLTPCVLRATQAARVPYIDAGGAACDVLPLPSECHTLARIDAGAVPGLSGLLPRWLAQSFSSVEQLRVWHGIVDSFTSAGAEDFIAGIPAGGAKHGSPLPTPLPFFPRPVIVEPYRNPETTAVGQALALAPHQQQWFNVSEDAAFVQAREQLPQLSRPLAIEALCQATQTDCLRYRPYVRYLVELSGMQSGRESTQTFLISSTSVADASGSFMAALALDVLHSPQGDMSLTQLHAAQHRPSSTLIDALFAPATGLTCQQLEGPMEGFMDTQGGAL